MIFGFPLSNNRNGGGYTIKPASKIISSAYKFDTNVSLTDNIGNTYIDSLNYYITLKDYVVDSTLEGFSGAPVFARNKDSNKWSLLGIMTATNTRLNIICVVKARYIPL